MEVGMGTILLIAVLGVGSITFIIWLNDHRENKKASTEGNHSPDKV